MSFKIKEDVYVKIIGLLPMLQVLFDTINVAQVGENVKMYVGASLMLLILIVNAFKIYFDPNKSNNALWLTIVMAVLFVVGGVLDQLDIFNLNEKWQGIVRTIATLLMAVGAYLINAFGDKNETSNS